MNSTTNAVQICILSKALKSGKRSVYRFYQKLDGTCYAYGGLKGHSIQFENIKQMQVCIGNYLSMYNYNYGYVTRPSAQLALAM